MEATRCRHFDHCGGCSLQHLDYPAQLAQKSEQLRATLSKIGGVEAAVYGPALHAEPWAYRHRARVTVRCEAPDSVFIGFRHQPKRRLPVDMRECPVLPLRFTELLEPLRKLFGGLSGLRLISQLEVAVTSQQLGLVLRVMESLTDEDRALLLSFEQEHGIRIYLQAGNMDTIELLDSAQDELLEYQLNGDLALNFHPRDFTQVNPEVNRLLVDCVLKEMDPEAGEKIADLFCGIGNFSLSLAQQGANITGMEYADNQVQRATDNASKNQLSDSVQFVRRDLSKASQALGKELAGFDKLLLDPPRSGAPAVVASLKPAFPRRIVYVSCNPETLAQDASMLVSKHGYKFKSCRLVDMFPHTDHSESLSVFERDN